MQPLYLRIGGLQHDKGFLLGLILLLEFVEPPADLSISTNILCIQFVPFPCKHYMPLRKCPD